MPGLISKSKKPGDDNDDNKDVYRRVRVAVARERSRLSDDEIMNHPGMMRLLSYLENLPVEDRILEFTVRSSEEEARENQSGLRAHEIEEARRMREMEEDRKNYMNRYFR